MKKLFLFAVGFIAFTNYSFTIQKAESVSATTVSTVQTDFSFFRIHRQAKNVVLNWGIDNPTGVTGFIIERSYDGDFFEEIGQEACNNSVKFSYKDLSVYPGYIYYRVGCITTDGRMQYSPVEVIRIVMHG